MNEETLYQLALSRISGIGATVAKTLVSYTGSAKTALTSPLGKLDKIPGIGPKLLSSLKNSSLALSEAETIAKEAEKRSVNILCYTQAGYPYRLKQIADAPNILYYKGTADLQQKHCLAIVGTRKASAYGRAITEQFLQAWAPYQPIIVSGLAYGIDVAAHRTALNLGLPTIGVMASGIDIVYPPAHQKYAQEMLHQGGLLTEHPFGVKPDAFHFPSRNRIIAGMSQATVVIEAAEKGGALITAHLARDYDREVFAVPGSLQNEVSAGCHQIIRQQIAQILYKPEQLIEDLNWKLQGEGPSYSEPDFSELNENQKTVANVLRTQPEGIHIDTLVHKCGLPYSEIPALLLELEFTGWVRALPGKKYQLVRK